MVFVRFLVLLPVTALLTVSCTSKAGLERRDRAIEAGRAAAVSPRERPLYRIGPGDTLKLEHRFNEELNRVVVVRPDGYVSLPLVPDLEVAGRTPPEVQQEVDKHYANTVKRPGVTVTVEIATNGKICVAGEVMSPGLFPISDGLTVLRALAMAGGPRPTAKMNSIVILRDDGQPEPLYLIADLNRVTEEFDGRGVIELRPKDIVFVPRSTIAKMDAFVDQYLNQLIPFSKNLGVTYLIGSGVY